MATKKRAKYTSKGQRSSVSRALINEVRKDRPAGTDLINLSTAWKKCQNPWLTIENPNKNETNKRFIRVRANDYWGNPKPKREENREG